MVSLTAEKPEALQYACRLRNISKSFGSVRALDDVSTDIRHGEVLAIVGENGAGKSTLMNVLFGLLKPDHGDLEVDTHRGVFQNSSQAIAAGLGMVHQHFMLYPQMSVLENVLIGAEGKTAFGLIDFAARKKQIQSFIDQFGFGLDLDKRVGQLSMDARQQLEIVKLLYRGSQIIILDEPTAVLIPQEVEALFSVIRKLKQEGKSIILVTHKLAEVMSVSDRVVVMRGGRKVAEVNTAGTTESELAGYMIGRKIEPLQKLSYTQDKIVLKVEKLTVKGPGKVPLIDAVSTHIHAGEILGIAGVSGSGQKELVEALIGTRHPDGGTIELDGKALETASVKKRRAAGMVYIAEDRMSVGLAIEGTLSENIIAGQEDKDAYSGRLFLRFRQIRQFAENLISQYDIRTTGPSQTVSSLSGGNKQKIIVARELSRSPRLVIAENPSWGVDIGAISFIHQKLMDCAKDGSAVMLVSTELEELFALCDRVIVLFNGKMTAEFERSELDAFEIGRAMSGGSAA